MNGSAQADHEKAPWLQANGTVKPSAGQGVNGSDHLQSGHKKPWIETPCIPSLPLSQIAGW